MSVVEVNCDKNICSKKGLFAKLIRFVDNGFLFHSYLLQLFILGLHTNILLSVSKAYVSHIFPLCTQMSFRDIIYIYIYI